jgi:hypothetical protein
MAMKKATVVYKGQHFIDLVGETITVIYLSERLDKTSNTIRVALKSKGAIKRGFITDDDISHYLPNKAVINKHNAALELSARAWS